MIADPFVWVAAQLVFGRLCGSRVTYYSGCFSTTEDGENLAGHGVARYPGKDTIMYYRSVYTMVTYPNGPCSYMVYT